MLFDVGFALFGGYLFGGRVLPAAACVLHLKSCPDRINSRDCCSRWPFFPVSTLPDFGVNLHGVDAAVMPLGKYCENSSAGAITFRVGLVGVQFRSGHVLFRLKLGVAECENGYFRTATDPFDLQRENHWLNTGVFKLDLDSGRDALADGVLTP